MSELGPLLKWVGGKRWLVPRLIEYYDPRRRLVDPFVGGMSVPLGLQAKTAIISDINPHLVNLYRWLQAGLVPDGSVNLTNTEKVYYENRERFNELCKSKDYWTREGALLFYYLNRSCFNGLCRFNQDGIFNAAYGKYKKLVYREDFSDYQEAMKDWQILHGDFDQVQLQSGDFVYADPPYDNTFTKFTKEDFGWSDQERLARWLSIHTGPVIASNSYTDRIVELYRGLGFTVYLGSAPRRVACNGDRTPATEMLAFKNF